MTTPNNAGRDFGSSDGSSGARYCCVCRFFCFPGWCHKHDNHVTTWLTCKDWEQAGTAEQGKCDGSGPDDDYGS